MARIHHDIEARCEPAKVWALLADLEAVRRYNPIVKSVVIQGPLRTGVGAQRVCEFAPQGRAVERVTRWEEGHAIGFEVAESDWPIHYMRWITRLEPRSGATRITQELEYRVKYGPVGWLMDNLVMKRKLRATLDSILAEMVKQAEQSP